jgi:hypothetical protein
MTSVNDDLADEIRHLAVELAEYWADGEPADHAAARLQPGVQEIVDRYVALAVDRGQRRAWVLRRVNRHADLLEAWDPETAAALREWLKSAIILRL